MFLLESFFAVISASVEGGSASLLSLKNSLISLLILFLLTAFATRAEMEIPILVRSVCVDKRWAVKFSVNCFLPSRLTLANSADLRSLSLLAKECFFTSGVYLPALTATVRRFLPLALLLLITFLPPGVSILWRKPWARSLFLLLG